jgi:hypothetical protein
VVRGLQVFAHDRPLALVVGDTLFVHAGLKNRQVRLTLDA